MFFKKNKKRKYVRIFASIFLVLITVFVGIFPSYASILPLPGTPYNYSSAISSNMEFSCYMQGANGYNDRYYDYSSLSRENISSMGTNDVAGVSKPSQYLPMTTFSTDDISISYDLTNDFFVNEYNDATSGYYRYRTGVYVRAFGDQSGASQVDVNLGYVVFNSNGDVVVNGANDGVYIPTGVNVPGTYYSFSLDFYYDVGYSVSLEIHIKPKYPDNYIRFSGSTPYYRYSFLAFTASYIDYVPTEDSFYLPLYLGTVRYVGGYRLLYDSAEPVFTSYTNPFDTSDVITADGSTRLFVNDLYPGILYQYEPTIFAFGVQYGVLYKCYTISNDSTEGLPGYNSPYDDYYKGYNDGYEVARSALEQEVNYWLGKYNELIDGKGSLQSYWYNIGKADGVESVSSAIETTYSTLDRFGNLFQKCSNVVLNISAFGINLRVIAVTFVVLLFSIFIIKKVK